MKQPLNNLGEHKSPAKLLIPCVPWRELGGTVCDHRNKGKDTELPWLLVLPIYQFNNFLMQAGCVKEHTQSSSLLFALGIPACPAAAAALHTQ